MLKSVAAPAFQRWRRGPPRAVLVAGARRQSPCGPAGPREPTKKPPKAVMPSGVLFYLRLRPRGFFRFTT